MSRPKVDFHDLGIGKLKEQLAELAASTVTIGWQGQSGAQPHAASPDSSVAEIAGYQEFGTQRIPERPALRTTFDQHRDDFLTEARRTLADLIDGRLKESSEVVERLGAVGVDKLRDTIDRSQEWATPLAGRTAKGKGHAQPWVDTGVVYDAASWAHRIGDQTKKQGGEIAHVQRRHGQPGKKPAPTFTQRIVSRTR